MTLRLLIVFALLIGTVPAFAQRETTADYRRAADAELSRLRDEARPNRRRAKNVIIFIGDGMGISTLTAARILQGQRAGRDGESLATAIDGLAHTALVRTWSHDAQVSDSAPTATAILAGIKTRNGVIGVGPEVAVGDCAAGRAHQVPSLFVDAQASGRATGVISTARITHATPAAVYAHTPERDWEDDADMPAAAKAAGCTDIARQLVEGDVGSRLDVVMGGGRARFLPTTITDPERAVARGRRTDGRDLTEEWQRRHPDGSYAWNAATLGAARETGPLLALFEPDHMQYEADRGGDAGGEPSLAEMTMLAIGRLSRDRQGYVLMVEAGRIDHAHHAGNARRALEDTLALDEAVRQTLARVNLRDTLVLVTADHSHAFAIAGYPARGNPILGLAADAEGTPLRARDGKAYTTLGYANGPGAVDAPRPDPATTDTTALDYRQQALVPLGSETHAGEDVAVRASGPMTHLFSGTIEQNSIARIVRYAMTGR